MTYKSLFIIGIVLQVLAFLVLCLRTIRRSSKEKLQIGMNLSLLVILAVSIFISMLSLSYNNYFLRGSILIAQGRCSEATSQLLSALKIRKNISKFRWIFDHKLMGTSLFFSTEINIRMKLAECYKASGDYSNAIRQYQAVILKDKNNFDATASIADIYFLAREYPMAKSYYERLTKLKPNKEDGQYYYQMGKAFMMLFKYDIAIRYFKHSLVLGVNITTVKPYLEICYSELGGGRGDQGEGGVIGDGY